MTNLEIENAVWLRANQEEKELLLDYGLSSKQKYVRLVFELGKKYVER